MIHAFEKNNPLSQIVSKANCKGSPATKRPSDSKRLKATTMTAITAEIINEFVEQIDNEKEYQLKELKQVLSDVYKAKTQKPKATKAPKEPKQAAPIVSDSDDEDKPKKRGRPTKSKLDKDGNEKVKRAPSGYNIYMGQRIKVLKVEQPDTPAKELLKIAAAEWKQLDKAEQEQYKA